MRVGVSGSPYERPPPLKTELRLVLCLSSPGTAASEPARGVWEAGTESKRVVGVPLSMNRLVLSSVKELCAAHVNGWELQVEE